VEKKIAEKSQAWRYIEVTIYKSNRKVENHSVFIPRNGQVKALGRPEGLSKVGTTKLYDAKLGLTRK